MAFFLMLSQFSQAQLKYSIERNDPEGLPNLAVNFAFLTVGIYEPDYTFGMDIGAEYTFNNQFLGGIRYKKSYIENLASGWDGGFGLDIKKTSGLDFYGEYILKNDLVKGKEEIKLADVGDTRYVTNVEANQLIQYTIRFGYSSNSMYVETDQEGFEYSGVRVKTNTNFDQLNNDPVDFWGTNVMTNNYIHFGASRTKKMDVKVDFKGSYKKKDYKYKSQIYFDIMFAVKQEFQNMNVDVHYSRDGSDIIDGIYVVNDISFSDGNFEYEVTENTLVSPFGLRAGYKLTSYRFFGFGYSAELGFRPGPGSFVGNVYFDLGLNINLFSI